METMRLVGAEEVTRAARMMAEAADKMQRAASEITAAQQRQELTLGNFLLELKEILDRTPPVGR